MPRQVRGAQSSSPSNAIRSPGLRLPFSPTLVSLFAPEVIEMKCSREHARRQALRELDRQLQQRGPAAVAAMTESSALGLAAAILKQVLAS